MVELPISAKSVYFSEIGLLQNLLDRGHQFNRFQRRRDHFSLRIHEQDSRALGDSPEADEWAVPGSLFSLREEDLLTGDFVVFQIRIQRCFVFIQRDTHHSQFR